MSNTSAETPEEGKHTPEWTPNMVFYQIQNTIPNGRQFLESVNQLITNNASLERENAELKQNVRRIYKNVPVTTE